MKWLKSKFVLIQIAVFFGLIALDQLSKHLSSFWNTGQGHFLGFSLSAPVKNYHLAFGWDFNLNNLFVIVTLTALLCLFIFYYVFSFIFINKVFSYLQTGITFLAAGLISNLSNKLFNAYVIDFIKWSLSPNIHFYFNLSDVFQTLGWCLIAFQLFFFKKHKWQGREKRGRLLILKNYQLQFIAYIAVTFFFLSFFFVMTTYQWFQLISFEGLSNVKQMSYSFFKYSLSTLLFLCLLITSFFFYLSNKIYGPLYAFEKYIYSLIKGENPKDLKLRKGDQLKTLEDLAKDIKSAFDKSK